MGVFAAAEWVLIPASPLGATAGGPVQSNDNRFLWWCTETQIAAFDCALWEWVGPWAWDGQTVICASQVSGQKCIFSFQIGTVTYFRSFNLATGGYVNIDWLCASNYENSEYHGYEGPFGSPIPQFGYDSQIAGKIIGFICDGLGPGVTAFVTANISDGRLGNGIFLNNQFGDGSLTQLIQGGINGFAYYGRVLAGDLYATIPGLNKIPFGAIAAIVEQTPTVEDANFMSITGTLSGRSYTFGQAVLFYPDPFEFSGPDAFEDNLYNLTIDGLGGFAGPNALLLTQSKTESGNPSSFTYAEVIYTSYGGTFGTPFPVTYSPVGDNPLHVCGYDQQIIAGELGSTEWYYLAIAQSALQVRSVVNYFWNGGRAA